MGDYLDTNEENSRDKNFEKHNHKDDDNKTKDAEGRENPEALDGSDHAQNDIENDGGGVGRNNGGDMSGR